MPLDTLTSPRPQPPIFHWSSEHPLFGLGNITPAVERREINNQLERDYQWCCRHGRKVRVRPILEAERYLRSPGLPLIPPRGMNFAAIVSPWGSIAEGSTRTSRRS